MGGGVRWGKKGRECDSSTEGKSSRRECGVEKEKDSFVLLSSVWAPSLTLAPILSLPHIHFLYRGEKGGEDGARHTLTNTHTDVHTALAETITSHTHYYFLMI